MKLEELLGQLAVKRPTMKLQPETTALVLIDMVKSASGDYLVDAAVKNGISESEAQEAVVDLNHRLKDATRNAQKLLTVCRAKGIRPIHVKIESYASDGADVGRLHKTLGYIIPPGSVWAEFLEEVKPLEGEIVLTKTCSGAFTGTMLNQVLRNLGIEEVIIVGFYTDQCITTAARDSADLGYTTLVVTDAVMAELPESHISALKQIVNVYVTGKTAAEVVDMIRSQKR